MGRDRKTFAEIGAELGASNVAAINYHYSASPWAGSVFSTSQTGTIEELEAYQPHLESPQTSILKDAFLEALDDREKLPELLEEISKAEKAIQLEELVLNEARSLLESVKHLTVALSKEEGS